MLKVKAINNSFWNDEDNYYEVGIEFENGDKGYAVREINDDFWEIGEGDYI